VSQALKQQNVTDHVKDDTEVRAGGGESSALAVGGIAALLVGACCVAPIVLVAIGLGGAWLANLAALEPYRPVFSAITLACLAFAWRRIYRPASACKPGETCAVPAVKRSYKIGFWTVAVLLVVMFSFPYAASFFL
jgi:mercuric ion transport protein